MEKLDDLEGPLELAIQEMETLDAPGWATATGFFVSATAVATAAGAAYT